MKRFRVLPAVIVAVVALAAAGITAWLARRGQSTCHRHISHETNRYALFVTRILLPTDRADHQNGLPANGRRHRLSALLRGIPSNQQPPLVYAAHVGPDGSLQDLWLRPDAGKFSSQVLPKDPEKSLAALSEGKAAGLVRLNASLPNQSKLKLGFEAPKSPAAPLWPALLVALLGLAAAAVAGFVVQPAEGPAKEILHKALKEAKPELADDTAPLETTAKAAADLCRTQAKAMEQLQAYLPPALFDRISTGQSIGGEERAVAVMHVRLGEIAELLATEPSDKVLTLANTYLDGIIEVLVHHQAVIGSITLDAVEAWWGSPEDIPEPEVHACKAAVGIRRSVFELERRQKTIGHPVAHVSIGIASGRCLLARLGSTRQMRPTLVGQASRDALRLATMAGPEEILVTQATAMLVQDAGLRLESLSSPDQDSTLWRLLSEKG